MSEIIEKKENLESGNERLRVENEWIRKSKIPSEENIGSKVLIRFNENQLSNSLITELLQTIQFKGEQISMMEYYFLKNHKRIWITQDWDNDGYGYMFMEFYCDSVLSTEEIKNLTRYNEYTGVDNLFGGLLLHVYYQNINNKKGYFQMCDGSIDVGYSFEGNCGWESKLNEDIENLIELQNNYDKDKGFHYNESVKSHTITFEEINNELNLSSNVIQNRDICDSSERWNTDWDLKLLKKNINFNRSKNRYVFWGTNHKFKKTLLRDSYKYIKSYLPTDIKTVFSPSHI